MDKFTSLYGNQLCTQQFLNAINRSISPALQACAQALSNVQIPFTYTALLNSPEFKNSCASAIKFRSNNLVSAFTPALNGILRESLEKSLSLLSASAKTFSFTSENDSRNEQEIDIPDAFYDTAQPILELIDNERLASEPAVNETSTGINEAIAQVKQRPNKLSSTTFQFLINLFITIVFFIFGQASSTASTDQLLHQGEHQTAIEEDYLETSEHIKDMLEDSTDLSGQEVALLQSIDDSLQCLIDRGYFPGEDSKPSAERNNGDAIKNNDR